MEVFRDLWQRLRDPGLGGLWIGLILFSFGLWLVLPWGTFETSTRSFDAMAGLASEEAWGLVMLAGSGFLIRGTVRFDPEWASTGALVAAFCYFFIWSSFTTSNWRGVSTAVYFILMLRALLLYVAWRDEARYRRKQYLQWLKRERIKEELKKDEREHRTVPPQAE